MHTIEMKEAIHIWHEHASPATDHLDIQTLYHLCLPGHLADASHADIDHLARCPACLEKWELLTRMTDASFLTGEAGETGEDMADAPPMISYGLLKAAAGDFSEPVFLKSHCRRFVLGLFIDPEQPDKGMVTLDVTGSTDPVEDRQAMVKDAAGRCVLKARIRNGRAAARIDDINQYDFSAWTITVIPAKAGA